MENWSPEWRGLLQIDKTQEFAGMMEIFCIFIVVVVLWLCICQNS